MKIVNWIAFLCFISFTGCTSHSYKAKDGECPYTKTKQACAEGCEKSCKKLEKWKDKKDKSCKKGSCSSCKDGGEKCKGKDCDCCAKCKKDKGCDSGCSKKSDCSKKADGRKKCDGKQKSVGGDAGGA